MELPPTDPTTLLSVWMDWERGEAAPGKTLAGLKRAGMRTVLEDLVMTRAELADLEPGGPGEQPPTP